MSAPPSRSRELATRSLVGVGLIALAAAALWIGNMVWWLLAAVLGVFMMAEWADLVGAPRGQKRLAIGALFVAIAIMSPPGAGPRFFALGLLLGAGVFVLAATRRPWLAAGVLYAGLPVLALLLIRRQLDYGFLYALWTLALVWATDIGAYFAGRAIGGPKLAPRLSPNKTRAGLGGGIVLASLFALILHFGFGLAMRLTLATPVLAVVAQSGDLFESWLKRRAGVKDSGTLFPGHGGVLDRLDGLVPVAPLAAFLVVAVPQLYTLL